MRRALGLFVVAVVTFAVGAAGMFLLLRKRSPEVDPPALVSQMREVARLETLEVRLYKKVSLTPDPPPSTTTLWGDVASWAKFTLRNPNGKAIIFAVAHLGLDLDGFSQRNLRVVGTDIEVVLPEVKVQVELLPGETEVIGSNLNSQETAQLFEVAKRAFEQEVRQDRRLVEKARESGRRQLRALLLTAGFREVRFVEALPVMAHPG